MLTLSTAWRLLLFLLLLTSCRSEKVAFQFWLAQVAPTGTAIHNDVALNEALTLLGVPAPVGVALKQPTFSLSNWHNSARHSHASTAGKAYSRPETQVMQSSFKRVATRMHTTTQHTTPQHVASKKGTMLQLIGTVLAVAGVVVGLTVGGWAGFGFFALLALVGLGFAFWGSFVVDGELP
jgi:hypothetical protein